MKNLRPLPSIVRMTLALIIVLGLSALASTALASADPVTTHPSIALYAPPTPAPGVQEKAGLSTTPKINGVTTTPKMNAPLATSGCLTGVGPGLYNTVSGTVNGAGETVYFAGVLYATVGAQPNVPAFCINLHNPIAFGDCFTTDGSASPALTWLLANYPPSGSITDDEGAARQAAVWFYSDGFVVTGPANVVTRTQQILASVPNPLPASLAPQMTIDPPSAVNALPLGTSHQFTVTVTLNGQPLASQAVNLATTFGQLSANQVTTNGSGQATFTLTNNTGNAGKATITASFTYGVSGTTVLLPNVAGQQELVIVTTTPTLITATATKEWHVAPQMSSNHSRATALPNQVVTDTVTFIGTTAGGAVVGNVQFFICSSASPLIIPDCTTGGATLGSPVATTATGVTPPTAQAISPNFSTATDGAYCFRAEFTPAPGSLYLAASHTNQTTECFTVSGATSVSLSTLTGHGNAPISAAALAAGGLILLGTLAVFLRRR